MKKKNFAIEIILILLIIGFLVYSYLTKGFFYNLTNFNVEELTSFVSSFSGLSFLVYILIIILSVIITPIHPLVFYVAGGIIFGPYVAWALAMIGTIIGASVAFHISKRYGRFFIEKRISKEKLKKFDKLSDKHGALSIFLLRVNPITSSDIWTYIAGLTKMNFWKFLAGTALGLAPAIFVQTYFGKAIKENATLFNIFIIIAVVYLVLLVLGILYFLIFKKKKDIKIK